MISKTIYVRASRQEVLDLLRSIPKLAKGSDVAAQALCVRMGLALLGRIKQAFVVKSHGGTDDTGLKWKPLARSTVAYKRRHPGLAFPGSRRAPKAPSAILSDTQRSRWWQLYRSFGGQSPTGRAYHAKGNRSWAAAFAWNQLKREGAPTIIGRYGDTQVDILRDKGLLLNSLSPGVVVGVSPPPVPPNVPANGVFRYPPGTVIVGTNRKFCLTHHRGVAGKIPQRRLWPKVKDWTANWWRDIEQQGVYGLVDIMIHSLSRL